MTALPGITLGDIAVRFGCELRGDPDARVERVATLMSAAAGSLGFLANPAYRRALESTEATAVILQPHHAPDCPTNALLTADPYLLYARVARELHPERTARSGIHPQAVLADGAVVPASCEIGPGVTIGANSVLGENVVVGANCAVGADVRIGADTRLEANVTLYTGVRVGQRCILHSGAVVGADGFGIAPSASGWVRVPQVGSVLVGDDVDIGANSCIDRGAIDDTRIGNDVKIDNLVQIGHNVVIGDHTAIAGMAGVAGSTTIGSGCLIGGAASVSGHLTVCDGANIMGRASVTRSITEPGVYASHWPAEEASSWRKLVARVRRLDATGARVKLLEQRIKDLQTGKDDAQ